LFIIIYQINQNILNVKTFYETTSLISSLDLKALDLAAPWYRLRAENALKLIRTIALDK
jgi:hypothetical protein